MRVTYRIIVPWIGLPLNFLAMFIVGYFFTSTIKKPFYIAFGLQYLFILTTPVSLGDFPMRLLSLVTGAIVIMITQWLFNRHKLSKQSDKYLVQTCEHLQAKINLIRDNQENPQLDSKIYSSINELLGDGKHGKYKPAPIFNMKVITDKGSNGYGNS